MLALQFLPLLVCYTHGRTLKSEIFNKRKYKTFNYICCILPNLSFFFLMNAYVSVEDTSAFQPLY